jgi:hypothetical protein
MSPRLFLLTCITLCACGPTAEQRAATITFGRSVQDHGALISDETVYLRSEIKTMRILALSLPGQQSLALFSQGSYRSLANDLPEPRIEKMVQIGGAAGKFGESLAKVADLTSSTADEKIFSAATRQLIQTAGAIGNAASGVSVGAPAVNLLTFTFTQHYRLRYLERALPAAEPGFRSAQKEISAEFDSKNSNSLLYAFVAATDQLATLLQSSVLASAAAPPQNREIIANGYGTVARNRDHITYVTNRQLELMNKAIAAYDALTAAIQGDTSQLDAVDAYSNAVQKVRHAFQSLR